MQIISRLLKIAPLWSTEAGLEFNCDVGALVSQPRAVARVLAELARKKHPSIVEGVLSWMNSINAEVNVYHHNALANAYAKVAQWTKALQLLRMLIQDKGDASMVTYNVAISACERAGEWDKASALLSMMMVRKLRVSTIACSAVISACSRSATGVCEKNGRRNS